MNSKLAGIETQLDPFPVYAAMRESQPVYYDLQSGRWNVFCFDDVQRVLSEYTTFSSQFGRSDAASAGEPFSASLISTDPPRHRQLRSLVTQAFTPKAVDALAPRISEIVNEYLDRVQPKGRMDVITDLGYPLPVIVIAELLGIPAEDRDKFKHWSDTVVQSANFGTEVEMENFMSPEIMEMGMYFLSMIEQRRQAPQDDLITRLLEAHIEGEHLTEIELLGFCVLLLVAGNETTTNLIGNSMLTFAEHPDVWERLRQSPDRLPQAIEEVLRFRSPVQAMFRVSKIDAPIHGLTIPARQPVVAWIGSANRDEDTFPDASRFDIERSPNKHLAFGNGIHYCLGAPLARLEAKIALGALLDRFKTFTLAAEARPERQPSLIVYGVKSLPIQFD